MLAFLQPSLHTLRFTSALMSVPSPSFLTYTYKISPQCWLLVFKALQRMPTEAFDEPCLVLQSSRIFRVLVDLNLIISGFSGTPDGTKGH